MSPDLERIYGSRSNLKFTRQKMVHWFDPGELVRTSIKLMLSSIFGEYSDKREMQGVLEADYGDYHGEKELWLDYLADTGDGFDSTYTVAYSVAQDHLEVATTDAKETLPRGRVLVLGGDQVYPTATLENYNNKFLGPYDAALPNTSEGDHPHLFAIPGNHDWYDGLTAFMRIFCQQGWIGGWRTQQSRSYFALRLPHGWWLWAIDIGFDAYIDEPQKRYFSETVGSHVRRGDRVIVCSAKPGWVLAARDGREAYRNVDYVERTIIRPLGARAVLLLSGDTHHYAHYADNDQERHYVTAGGGGAYLSPTHHLPAALGANLDVHELSAPVDARRVAEFPSVKVSRRKLRRVLFAPATNLRFVALLGLVPLIVGWTLQSRHGTRVLANASADELLRYLFSGSGSILLLIVLVVSLSSFANRDPRVAGSKHFVIGIVHAAAHLSVALVLVRVFANLFRNATSITPTAAVSIALFTLGGLASAVVMGIYLYASNLLFGIHDNEAFSIQGDPDWKNFLRLHFGPDGSLTVYPVGIRSVCRKWRQRHYGEDDAGAPRIEPNGINIVHELIEEPICFAPSAERRQRP